MTRNLREKLYSLWAAMHRRCYDETYHSSNRYGGRGILVELRWHTFENFYQDMAQSYFSGASVDRINNDGNYSPENCRFVKKEENTKPRKYSLRHVQELYNSGVDQKTIAGMIGTDQPYVSRLLKRANNGQEV